MAVTATTKRIDESLRAELLALVDDMREHGAASFTIEMEETYIRSVSCEFDRLLAIPRKTSDNDAGKQQQPQAQAAPEKPKEQFDGMDMDLLLRST